MKLSRFRTSALIVACAATLTFFAATALAQVVSYYGGQIAPGQDFTNGTNSNQFDNRMTSLAGSKPLGIYQVYALNGSVTRRKTDLSVSINYYVPGNPIYTSAHCYNPSGPAGPTFQAGCAYENTV